MAKTSVSAFVGVGVLHHPRQSIVENQSNRIERSIVDISLDWNYEYHKNQHLFDRTVALLL